MLVYLFPLCILLRFRKIQDVGSWTLMLWCLRSFSDPVLSLLFLGSSLHLDLRGPSVPSSPSSTPNTPTLLCSGSSESNLNSPFNITLNSNFQSVFSSSTGLCFIFTSLHSLQVSVFSLRVLAACSSSSARSVNLHGNNKNHGLCCTNNFLLFAHTRSQDLIFFYHRTTILQCRCYLTGFPVQLVTVLCFMLMNLTLGEAAKQTEPNQDIDSGCSC